MGKKTFTFVKGALDAVVWDPKAGRPLAEFTKVTKGLFKTNDLNVAKTLRKLGYELKNEYPDGPPLEGFEERVDEEFADVNVGDPDTDIQPTNDGPKVVRKNVPKKVVKKLVKKKKKKNRIVTKTNV